MASTFLSQWVGENPIAQGPAKQHEFTIYIPPLLGALKRLGARNIVDCQADEGVVSVAFCAQAEKNRSTFVLPAAADDPEGTFRRMAEDITAPLKDRITLAATPEDIKDASADAILFNNILGCQGSLENVESAIATAGRVVKPGGWAFVTVPNAHGENFSSYACSALPPKDAHGATYDFQMRGETATSKNLYLSDKGLRETFSRHGFGAAVKIPIADKAYEGARSYKPAFFQYRMCKLG